MEPPAVLLDVDGVLNPLKRGKGYRRFTATPEAVTYRLWLNGAHGAMLLDLVEATGSELLWASYWCGHANGWIGPRVGLPSLPHVPIPRRPADGSFSLGEWKADRVARWAGERPFVWFEDEPDVAEALARESGLGPHLLVPIDPVFGLTADHVAIAREWLDAQGGA
ncbi:HAD domain-containing protein [Actinocorallia longicatena]|uniref:HAD domain-containing protein n=1 Tax=Actinocorallia longicatena TaxID=111803 RepID=A0ABP6QLP7_9ACTN